MSDETTAAGGEQVTEETVREGLRSVLDPELHLDVIALGLIDTVDIASNPAEVKMLLTTPSVPTDPGWFSRSKKPPRKPVAVRSKWKCSPSSGALN